MLRYAQYVGDWSDYWHSYRWQKLPDGNHRTLGDAQAALALLRRTGPSGDATGAWVTARPRLLQVVIRIGSQWDVVKV